MINTLRNLGHKIFNRTTVTHMSISTAWIFLIVFGNVNESINLGKNEIICDDTYCSNTQITSYYYSHDCCSTKPYNVAYHLVSLGGSLIAFMQLCHLSKTLFYNYIALRVLDISFMFRSYIINASFITPYIALIYVYHYLQYSQFHCSENQMFCEHHPYVYTIVHNVYLSMIILLSIYLVTQMSCIALFSYVFFTKRLSYWKRICKIEDLLCLLQNDQNDQNDKKDKNGNNGLNLNHNLVVTNAHNIKNFVSLWQNKNDEDVDDEIFAQSLFIMKYIKASCDTHNSKNSNQVQIDISDIPSKSISFGSISSLNKKSEGEGEREESEEERISPINNAFYHNFKIENSDNIHDDLWSFLTFNNTYDHICIQSVVDACHALFFHQKELSNFICTDQLVISSVFKYISFALYPVGLIAITRVFGYHNSFGDGVDLFKTYILGLSIIASHLMGTLKFLGMMITSRPMNIGDIILFEGNTFKVKDFDLTHCYLSGSYHSVVPNDYFVNNKVINYTRENISDSCNISFPLNTSDTTVNTHTFFEVFKKYSQAHPQDILLESVRCGWTYSNMEKNMECNWKWKFKIHDRSRLNKAKTRIVDFINTQFHEIKMKNMEWVHLANGGAYNNN